MSNSRQDRCSGVAVPRNVELKFFCRLSPVLNPDHPCVSLEYVTVWLSFPSLLLPPNSRKSLGDEVDEGHKRQNEGCTLGVSFKILMIEQTRDFKTSEAYSN